MVQSQRTSGNGNGRPGGAVRRDYRSEDDVLIRYHGMSPCNDDSIKDTIRICTDLVRAMVSNEPVGTDIVSMMHDYTLDRAMSLAEDGKLKTEHLFIAAFMFGVAASRIAREEVEQCGKS